MAAFRDVQNANPKLTLEQAEAQARNDYRWLLEDPRGRRIARAVLRWSQNDETGPTSGEGAMAFAAGARMVGNMLKAQLRKHNPEGWVQLEAEFVRELAEMAREDAERQESVREQAERMLVGAGAEVSQ